MKNLLLPVSVALNFFIIAYLFFHGPQKEPSLQPVDTTTVVKRVVILSPASHPSIDAIEKGAIAALKKELPNVSISLMNADGKKTLMLAQVQETLSSRPDAIITIGAQAAQFVQEFSKKRDSKALHVFTAVSHPEKLGIVYHPQLLTGVQEKTDFSLTAATLNHLVPQLRSLLLVYNPGDGNNLNEERKLLEDALKPYDIIIKPVEVFQSSEISHKAKSLIAQCDAVIILKDHTVVTAIDSLIKICEQHKKMLIAHNLDSSEKGAALCFGADEKTYGLQAGALVAQALITKKELPPIAGLEANYVKINTKASINQNFKFKPIEMTLFKSIIII